MTQFCYQIGSNVIFVSVEGDRNVCNWQYIKLLVHFQKIADFIAKDGVVLSAYCTTKHLHDNE